MNFRTLSLRKEGVTSPFKTYILQVARTIFLLACASQLAIAQDPPAESPDGDDSPIDAVSRDVIESRIESAESLFEIRNQGDQAYDDGFFDIAEKFYTEYWKGAYDQNTLVDAAVRLTKSRIPQGKIEEASALLGQIPAELEALYVKEPESDKSKLSENNDLKIRFWIARLLLIGDDTVNALSYFLEVKEKTSDLNLKTKADLGIGECYIAMRRFDQAESILTQVTDSLVDDADIKTAGIGLIRIAITRADYGKAEGLIDTEWSDALDDYRVTLGLLRITMLLKKKDADTAYTFYRENFSEDPRILNNHESYLVIRSLGLTLLENKKFDSAIAIFERILPILREEARKKESLLDLAGAEDAAGQLDNAIGHYTRYLSLYENDTLVAKIQLRVAQLHEKQDNTEAALEYYGKVYDAEKGWPAFKYQAAHSMALIFKKKLKDYEKAIKYFYESSKLDVPDEDKANGIFYAAETYFFIEDFNNSAIHYQSVADSHPTSGVAEQSRHKQAIARYNGKRFRMAAEAFNQYLTDWPDGEFTEESWLHKGISERLAGDYTIAIQTLKEFITRFADSLNAPRALLEASQSAVAADIPRTATKLLDDVISKHKNSEHYPYALYRRAFLNLSYGLYDEARKDSFEFLEKFADSHPKLAADVYLWLGDHFANNRDFSQAEYLFLEVVRRYKDSDDAPVALYEAAKCDYNLSKIHDKDYQKALTHIVQLLSGYPDAPQRIIAQAKFLRGDIISIKGDFEQAISWFEACAKMVPGTDLYNAAMGRLAECHYSIATVQENSIEEYRLALSYLNKIIEVKNINYRQLEMARYRAAKIYELINQPDNAIDEYFHIFYKRIEATRKNEIHNWYYFARAGFDLARLYIEKGEYSSAKRVYTRMENSDIPISEDAGLKARELSKIYLE